MKLNCKISTLIFTLLLLNVHPTFAGEFTKEINRTFKIAADGKVDITNRHGKVSITTWDKNSVKIQVKIMVRASNASNAENYLRQMKVEFEAADDWVKATTIKERTKNNWRNLWGLNNSSWNYKVQYKVYMPKTNSLKLYNKYGDVYLTDLKGDADISVRYGNGKISQVKGDLKFFLGYGAATISDVKVATVQVKYSKLIFRNAKNVNIQSKHSKITIDKASDIRSFSKYDDYNIGAVDDLKSEGKYDDFVIETAGNIDAVGNHSDYSIEHLLGAGEFDMEYGDVIIKKLSKAFDKLKLDGKYTDFIISVDTDDSYDVDVSSEYTNIKLPKNIKKLIHHQENHSQELKGTVGSDISKGVVKVRAKYGSIVIEK